MTEVGTVLTRQSPVGLCSKVQARHLERLVVVYVRQSSLQQVQRHRESTQVQYGLRDLAQRLGWPTERTLVVDDDLGVSGASAEGRPGFQRVLSEVALDHVGLILGVEMSRLARSCRDWYQLLELCALYGTLIGDLDGLYDPAQYNDRLLLGLKGTMSEAELHVLKQRMLQGRLHKARRGGLRMPVPTGYHQTAEGEVILDPDEQVRATVRAIFEQFERLGTINAVLHYLVAHDVAVGVRARSGPRRGEIEWRRPNRSTLSNLLSNPIFAGAYVYGRRPIDPRRKKPGRRNTGRTVARRKEWQVCLHDRLPAYISWEQYERNIEQMDSNRTSAEAMGAIRHGEALLQGLIVCGRCGARMQPHYECKGRYVRYACTREYASRGGDLCQHLAARPVDAEVGRLALLALTPAALEVSLGVAENLERERGEMEKRWRQRLDRAQYEAERAARQYHAVEPEHRLVARTLEQAWEEKLCGERALVEEHDRSLREQPRTLSVEEREAIRRLAENLPAVWNVKTTTNGERKAILRSIIDRVVITVEGETEWVEATVHWFGGDRTYTRFRRPVARFEQLSNFGELKERVGQLKAEGLTALQIADRLNAEALRPPKRRTTFNAGTVRSLLTRQGLTRIRRGRTCGGAPLGPNEWWLPDLARRLDMHPISLYTWVRKSRVKARQLDGHQGHWVVTADQAEIERLGALRIRRRRLAPAEPENARPSARGRVSKV